MGRLQSEVTKSRNNSGGWGIPPRIQAGSRGSEIRQKSFVFIQPEFFQFSRVAENIAANRRIRGCRVVNGPIARRPFSSQ
jgi:hypothetical protein